jgi:Methyltransferase domain
VCCMREDNRFWSESFRRYTALIAQADVVQKVVYPSLIKMLSSKGAVLDYGGGTGLFLGLLPGDREVALYDPSKEAVALAEANCPREWRTQRRFDSSASDLPEKYFAEVVMCFVLMAIPTHAEEVSTLCKVRATMKPGAQLSTVITHPRFRAHRFSCFETDFSRGRTFNYDTIDDPFTVFLHGRDATDELALPNFHRPLDHTLDAIRSSGFRVETVTELYDYAEQGWFNDSVPPYLLITARNFVPTN